MPGPTLACAFPPGHDVVDHARRAVDLGYTRVWLYDSPALYGDVWIALARIAEACPGIALGTAVIVPSLRHVMVTASAIATIEELAPGRLSCAFGTGFTARNAMGRRAMRWSDVGDYVTTLRTLLRGGIAEVEGHPAQMLHPPGFAPPRPIEVPMLLAPGGPKGDAVARAVADGIVVIGRPPAERWDVCVQLAAGTVLEAGEDHTTPRMQGAVGPWYVVGAHSSWERDRAALDALPGGAEWRDAVERARGEDERHLAVHEGHLVEVTERDQLVLDAAGPAILQRGWTGTPDEVAARYVRAGESGATEVAYAPTGPDIARELETFAAAVAGSR